MAVLCQGSKNLLNDLSLLGKITTLPQFLSYVHLHFVLELVVLRFSNMMEYCNM